LGVFCLKHYLEHSLGEIMGTKRRSMFNPKFKSSRPARWELGRKLQGKETEAELEEQRLAEATALANEAVREAELKAKELAETLRLEELRIADEAKAAAELKAKEEAETLRLQQLRLAEEAELKAKSTPAKKKAPARKKAVKKTKSTRKPRTKKD
jgi:hypothetical protein